MSCGLASGPISGYIRPALDLVDLFAGLPPTGLLARAISITHSLWTESCREASPRGCSVTVRVRDGKSSYALATMVENEMLTGKKKCSGKMTG